MININKIKKGFNSVLELKDEMALTSYPDNIEPELIHPAKDNPYSLNDTPESIEELAASITALGLMHPLVVRKIADDEYELISGERRYKAITAHLGWRTIPCTVYENLSDNQAQLMLHDANLSTREYTPQEKLFFYPQIEDCINRMIESGTLKGAKQKAMADLLHISDRQIRKYKTIRENLSEKEIHEVEAGNLSVNAAYDKAKEVKADESGTSSDYDIEATEKYWEPIFEKFVQYYYGKERVFMYYLSSVPTTQDAIKTVLRPSGGYSDGNGFVFAKHELRTPQLTLQLQRDSLKNAPDSVNPVHKYSYSEVDAVIRRLITTHDFVDPITEKKCYRNLINRLIQYQKEGSDNHE